MMKKLILALLSAGSLCAFGLTVCAQEEAPSITVKGEGRVVVEPDLATVSFAVFAENEDASAAQEEVTQKANDVKAALLDTDLPEEKFATQGVNLSTNYDYSGDYPRTVGFRATVSMTVKEIPIGKVGEVLSVCSENGVNEINGVSVYYSDYDAAYLEALEKAMGQAGAKAERIAGAGGTELGGILSVAEGWQDTSMRSMTKSYSMDMVSANGMEEAVLDYSGGTAEVSATVTVTYGIQDMADIEQADEE